MKLVLKISALFIVCSLIQGCASEGMNKQSSGTLIGGLTGGLLGSRFGKGSGQLFATGAGALAGAMVGGYVGKGLDDQDRALLALSSQRALESASTGSSVGWKNPDNGHSGTITPTKTYQAGDGQHCREYRQTVYVGGKQQEAYGTACRKSDGSWQIQQ